MAGIVLSGGIAYLVRVLDLPPEAGAVIAASAVPLPAAIATAMFKRRRGLVRELGALSNGAIVRPTGLVVAMAAGVLLVIVQFTTFVAGFTVGLGFTADQTLEAQYVALGVALLYVAYPIIVTAAFFVGRRACHYFRRHPYAWLLVSVALFAVLQVAFDAMMMLTLPTIDGLAVTVGLVAAIYCASVLGAWRGMRRHEEFVAGQLVRKLPPEDLHAVTALIGETVDARLRASAGALTAPTAPLPQSG
ncbi:hypothetical protein [Agrococcus sp. Ld7]|uniref:hypothetical protein n=1 Tax=Agrococcus sp. Ld7 TaxID=649148 RepID=UPI00386991DB